LTNDLADIKRAVKCWRDWQERKEGKPIPTPEENMAELTLQAQEFAEKRLPLLKALQII
jgi:hypothetical protein